MLSTNFVDGSGCPKIVHTELVITLGGGTSVLAMVRSDAMPDRSTLSG